MRRLFIAALLTAGLTAGLTSSAQANLDDQSACQQADERTFSATEERYLSNPYRGKPHDQASIILTSWGVNTNDPFPRNITIYAKGPYTANCVIDYYGWGGFNVQWHVRTEVRLFGDGTNVNTYWNTARDCFGVDSQNHLVAPPNCGPYGAVDGNTALD